MWISKYLFNNVTLIYFGMTFHLFFPLLPSSFFSSFSSSPSLLALLGFPGGSVVKNHLPMQEMWVQSLVQEDPLEKDIATHSGILAWEIPWTEEPGRLHCMGSQKSWM